MKLCLFIDGLDEFDGDHEEISELFKGLTSKNVKFCLSSRPWVVFKECFRDLPSLRFQDLTRPDIKLYVKQTLSENSFFQMLARQHSSETSSFISEIVERADGVFLWVVVVVRSLLNGIRNRDSIPDLQLRLRRLPKELEPLYSHFLSSIEVEYLPWASKVFQILTTALQMRLSRFSSSSPITVEPGAETLSVLKLHLAMEQDVDISNIQTWTPKIATSRCEVTKFHLTARCAGLLETWDRGPSGPHSQIYFLHRTMRDYLNLPSVWESLISTTPPTTFNPNVSLFRACVLQIGLNQTISLESVNTNLFGMLSTALSFAITAESDELTVPCEMFDDLNSVMRMATGASDRHWSIPLTECHGLPPTDSFLPMAAMFGLTSYIASQLLKTRTEFVNNSAASLLHYAIPRNVSATYILLPRDQTIQLLLQTCDVNAPYNSITPWQQALSYLRRRQMQELEWKERAGLVRMLSAMLKAGANPRIGTKEDNAYGIRELVRDIEAGTRGKEGNDLGNILGELEGEIEKAFERVRDTPVAVSVGSLQAEIRVLPTLSFVSSGDEAGKKQS